MSTALTGAHLITGDGRDYDDATVKLEDNRIVEVETERRLGKRRPLRRPRRQDADPRADRRPRPHDRRRQGDRLRRRGDDLPDVRARAEGAARRRRGRPDDAARRLHRRARDRRARLPGRLPPRRSAEGPDRRPADARDRPRRLHDRRPRLVLQGGGGGRLPVGDDQARSRARPAQGGRDQDRERRRAGDARRVVDGADDPRGGGGLLRGGAAARPADRLSRDGRRGDRERRCSQASTRSSTAGT